MAQRSQDMYWGKSHEESDRRAASDSEVFLKRGGPYSVDNSKHMRVDMFSGGYAVLSEPPLMKENEVGERVIFEPGFDLDEFDDVYEDMWSKHEALSVKGVEVTGRRLLRPCPSSCCSQRYQGSVSERELRERLLDSGRSRQDRGEDRLRLRRGWRWERLFRQVRRWRVQSCSVSDQQVWASRPRRPEIQDQDTEITISCRLLANSVRRR